MPAGHSADALPLAEPSRPVHTRMLPSLKPSFRRKGRQEFKHRHSSFDHGVGHPLLLLCDAKAINLRNNKAFKVLDHYSEWPKVADAVIEADIVTKKTRKNGNHCLKKRGVYFENRTADS